ncbi:arsenate reductase ArsC [Mariprofundus erugo]|nr:arsenate reductase ArsC [Mariprofundus erugo]
MTIKVLFLSRHNAGRSQIAEHMLNHMGGGRFDAVSAGMIPAQVNPLAIEVLGEMGIDASRAQSRSLAQLGETKFDFIINICEHSTATCAAPGSETCPVYPGADSHGCWGFSDTMAIAEDHEAMRQQLRLVRDQLGNRLRIWMAAVDKPKVILR